MGRGRENALSPDVSVHDERSRRGKSPGVIPSSVSGASVSVNSPPPSSLARLNVFVNYFRFN